MIGGDDIDAAVVKRRQQTLAIRCRFDGRVTFDPRAERFVARLVKPQMVHTHLRGDALLRPVCLRKQSHLYRRRQVQYMQQSVVATREIDRHARRLQAGCRRANVRMLGHRYVLTVLRLGVCLVLPNRRGVFAMGNDHDRGVLEDQFENGRVVNKHVAR